MRDFYSSVLHNKGHLGVSSRNTQDNIKSLDLFVVKALNKDPNAYRDDSKDLGDNEGQADQLTGDKLVYTDDLEADAVDVVEKYENEVRR